MTANELVLDRSRQCDVCFNDMMFITSPQGSYWLCKVCNTTLPGY